MQHHNVLYGASDKLGREVFRLRLRKCRRLEPASYLAPKVQGSMPSWRVSMLCDNWLVGRTQAGERCCQRTSVPGMYLPPQLPGSQFR